MARQRVAFFLPSLAGGGAERVIIRLANEAVERGLAVDVVVGRTAGVLEKDLRPEVRIVDLDAARTLYGLAGLVRYLRRDNPNALLSAMPICNCLAVIARILARARGLVLVVSEHNTLSRKVSTLPWGRVLPLAVAICYRRADHVIAVSHGVAEDFCRVSGLPSRAVDVIHNPIVSRELVGAAYQTLDDPWVAESTVPVIVAAGRLTAAKDFPTLISAFCLVKRVRAARLVILGEGEDRGDLETLIRSHGIDDDVALPGFVSNPYQYMSHAAVFVLSSRWEGFGNVLAEALACGTPVVSTDCPNGPREILDGGRYGRLVPVGDEVLMAKAILAVLGGEPVQGDPAKAASRFSVSRAATRYFEFLGLSPGSP